VVEIEVEEKVVLEPVWKCFSKALPKKFEFFFFALK